MHLTHELLEVFVLLLMAIFSISSDWVSLWIWLSSVFCRFGGGSSKSESDSKTETLVKYSYASHSSFMPTMAYRLNRNDDGKRVVCASLTSNKELQRLKPCCGVTSFESV